jgi:hypothetical protein
MISLLAGVAIVMYLFAQTADTYTQAGKSAEGTLKQAQDRAKGMTDALNQRNLDMEKKLGLETPRPAATAPAPPGTAPAGGG